MQPRPAGDRVWGPVGDRGGVCRPLPDLRLHLCDRVHLRSLGGRGGAGQVHPLQGVLRQLPRPLPTTGRPSWCRWLLCRSPCRELLRWHQVFVLFFVVIFSWAIFRQGECILQGHVSEITESVRFFFSFIKDWQKEREKCSTWHYRSATGQSVQNSAGETLLFVEPGRTGMSQSGLPLKRFTWYCWEQYHSSSEDVAIVLVINTEILWRQLMFLQFFSGNKDKKG